MSLAKRIEKALIDAARILHEPIHKRLEWAGGGRAPRRQERRLEASIAVLEAILENLRISRNEWIPMCRTPACSTSSWMSADPVRFPRRDRRSHSDRV